MKAIIRIFKKLFAPIIDLIDGLRVLAWETDNGGVDGLTREDRERLEQREQEGKR